MSLSRFLSITSLAAAAGSAGCSDDACGPGDAPSDGVVASAVGVTLTYGHFTGSPNRDCPDSSAPSEVISLSIEGTQTDGSGRITLCVARPDLLARQAVTLGPNTEGTQVRVVDFAGSANSCTYTIDRATAPSGTASSNGLCGNGSDLAGFALVLDGRLPVTRMCGGMTDSLTIMLQGRVAVAHPPAARSSSGSSGAAASRQCSAPTQRTTGASTRRAVERRRSDSPIAPATAGPNV
jgi:hypothetical protein